MREIKFRAWDKKRNVMVTVDNEDSWDSEKDEWYGHVDEMALNALGSLSEERHVVQQYTGLKDKNGKEIYEGDILKTIDHFGMVFVKELVYDQDAFCVLGSGGPGLPDNCTWTQRISGLKNIEVIGNIYENPELLNPVK